MTKTEELLALADEKPNSINDDLYAWATQAASALREYAGMLDAEPEPIISMKRNEFDSLSLGAKSVLGTLIGGMKAPYRDELKSISRDDPRHPLYTHPPAPTTQEPVAAFDPGQIVNPYRRDSAAYWAWALARAATDAERHRIGKVTDTLLKSANEVLERVIAERDALRNALDKIAERTGSDDPCANYVQIARSALRVAAEIRKGTT